MEIFVTGATGAIGRPLTQALTAAGHSVVAGTRHPAAYTGTGRAVAFDLDGPGPEPLPSLDPDGMAAGADVAYYLVHALDQRDFAAVDRRRAERFAAWWGSDRTVVYLGGLGVAATSSAHLRSRHEVGDILRARCRTVELRASMVLGPASMSFQLLARLGRLAGLVPCPFPIPIPKASGTRTQPIAEADLLTQLVEAPSLPPGRYDVGGPEVLTYGELIERSARAQGHRLRVNPVVPLDPTWIGPAASLAAATDPWATTALFAGMGSEAVITGTPLPAARRARTGIDAAITAALAVG
jgi:uncharacterized protein YbjT (DUF2867 family)